MVTSEVQKKWGRKSGSFLGVQGWRGSILWKERNTAKVPEEWMLGSEGRSCRPLGRLGVYLKSALEGSE